MLPVRDLKEPPGGIGGGNGYPDAVPRSEGDYEAGSQSELEEAFSKASSGDVVYLVEDVEVTGQPHDPGVSAPDGITIAGDRGIGGSKGPRLWTDTNIRPMLDVGSDTRVTGIRVEGKQPYFEQYHDDRYEEGNPNTSYPAGGGVYSGGGCEFDNIEAYGFRHAALSPGDGSEVHDCYLHSNPMDSLGYGIVMGGGGHINIRRCSFDFNRHSVATAPGPTSWTLEDCWFGPLTVHHVIDHHGAAGAEIRIRNITVEATHNIERGVYEGAQDPIYDAGGHAQEAIDFRDQSPDLLDVRNSWFFHNSASEAIQVDAGMQNVQLSNNHFGTDEPAPDIGCPRDLSYGGGISPGPGGLSDVQKAALVYGGVAAGIGAIYYLETRNQ